MRGAVGVPLIATGRPPERCSGKPAHQGGAFTATGFGGFLLPLIGLDRRAVAELFSAFLGDAAASAQQIEFVDMVIDHLTVNGSRPPGLLYESPFTDIAPSGPEQVFTLSRAQKLVSIINEVKASAGG